MTNNNWEEEFWAKVKFYNLSLDNENYDDLMKFTKFFITKKDQEHKAELEMINGEVQKLLETLPELESDEYDAGLLDMKQLVLAILDSHINKQNI